VYEQPRQKKPVLGHEPSPQQVSGEIASVVLKPSTELPLPRRTHNPAPSHSVRGIFSLDHINYTCARDGKPTIFEGLDSIITPTSVHAAVANLQLDSFDVELLATRALEKVRERVEETYEYLLEKKRGNRDHEKYENKDCPDKEQKRAWEFVKYGLTEDEAASVFMYTAETSFYSELNMCCHNANRKRLIDFFPFLSLFIQALQKIPCRRGSFWKAMNSAHYKSKSKTVCWSFSSCSASIAVLKSMKPRYKERSVLVLIQDAYGANISEFS